MLNKKIILLRNKLDNMLIENADYETIYSLSIELDELIVEYYKNMDLINNKKAN